MAQVNLGRIGFVNKGSWNIATNYKLNDVVRYGGSTYAAKRPNVGITPPTNGTDTDDWFYFVNNSGNSGDYVDKTSNQTIAGIKTFSSVISGNISGNSATATKLATARTINGVAFDGSANITISTSSSDSTAVKLTGDQTVAGIKTFSSSPVVPTPTANTQAANKAYVDSVSGGGGGQFVKLTGNETIADVKTFSSSPIVPTPTANTQAANKAYVDSVSGGGNWSANDTRAKTALNASDNAPIYACRAWVNFNGTGTVSIRGSGNVSSITDNGEGNYTVNFTTAMTDTNYSIAGIASLAGSSKGNAALILVEGVPASTYALKTTSAITVYTINNNIDIELDAFSANVSIFR